MRVLHAMAEVVAENGLRRASVSAVALRAALPRSVFAELFDSIDACFLAMLDWVLEHATAAVCDAFEAESRWHDGALAGLGALLVFLDSEPVMARASLLEAVAASPDTLKRRAHLFQRLHELVDGARLLLSLERQPPATTAEATVASILGILRRRLLSGKAPPFVPLLGSLAETVVAPYFGPAAAAEAARRGDERALVLMCESVDGCGTPVEIPTMLRHASAHRMRACLLHLARCPGASNKAVAAEIGIAHLGQASTLLARLHDAGLLVKQPGGAGRPNAWSLSPYGAEVAQALL